jgi:hypothetical protein
MHITETSLDAHLPVTAPIEDHPDKYGYRFDATIWRTLHGHAPIRSLIWDFCVHDLYTAATELNELEISTDERGTRILDLYTDMAYSPFTRRTERIAIRGWDLVKFVCADPNLTIRFNKASELEMTMEAALLRRLGLELQNSRKPQTTHKTIVIGITANESTEAQS